jgi:hypothetical protein
MCHHLEWRAWELLRDKEQREVEEPRVEVAAEQREAEIVEPEPEPDRELVHA